VAARGRPRTRLAAKKKSEPLIEILEPDTLVEPPKENVVVVIEEEEEEEEGVGVMGDERVGVSGNKDKGVAGGVPDEDVNSPPLPERVCFSDFDTIFFFM
jgi:hypothetical protein